MKNLGTAIWNLKKGKPILDKNLLDATIRALRDSPDYLTPILEVAEGDVYDEALNKKLTKYAEDYRKSPNQSGAIDPMYIVLHHTAGSFWGSVDWILRKISQVSYHYVINPKDGSRIQHVWDKFKAWHAGKSFWKGVYGLNSCSIGIAFSGNTNKREVADFEIDSCARKIIYLIDKSPKMKGRKYEDIVISHKQIAPNRKDDCSDRDLSRVISRCYQLLPI